MHVVECIFTTPKSVDEYISVLIVLTINWRLKDEKCSSTFFESDAFERNECPLECTFDAHVEIVVIAVVPLGVVPLVVGLLVGEASSVIPFSRYTITGCAGKVTPMTANRLSNCEHAGVKLALN